MKSELMKKSITDKYGQEYQVSLVKISDHLYRMKIKQQKEYVGEAKFLLRMPDIMILGDIQIRNDFDLPESVIEEIMQRGRKRCEHKNYRERGLGTALLEEVITFGRQTGLKRIYGSAMKKDIIRTPHLLEWYGRHGFSRCDPYPNCIAGAEAWICKELN